MPRRKKQPEEPDLLDEVVNRLMDHPNTQDVLDKTTSFFDGFGILIDRAARRAVSGQATVSPARYRRLVEELAAARSRVDKAPPPVKKEDPRQVLGFGPAEKLSRKVIKDRQRALARIFHPDTGSGSVEAMQRLNAAADALLKTVKV